MKGGAFVGEALQPNTATMQANQRAGNKQAQADTIDAVRCHTVNAPKGLEDRGMILSGNVGAAVSDADLQVTGLCRLAQANHNGRIRWRKLPCVVEQVADDLPGPRHIA